MSKFINPRLRFVGEPAESGTPAVPATPATPVVPATPATPAAPIASEPTKLPDDHPLVTAFATQKAELADAKKRLTDIDDANKSDAQKQADKIATLETENTTLKAGQLRAEVAAAKGVPANLISGSTKAELEASADALITFKGAAALPGNQRPAGPVTQVQEHEETREDRLKRLEGLKR